MGPLALAALGCVAATLVSILTPEPTRAGPSGGAGSNVLFSLDRGSPTLAAFGYSAADLFVDDSGNTPGASLTLALPAAGLGLTSAANVTGLSSGRDDGISAILSAIGAQGNPMSLPEVRYQFSAGRLSIDGVTGTVPIPGNVFPTIQHHDDFALQFSNNDQAGDVFDNAEGFGRLNFVQMTEEHLKLLGNPPGPPTLIDNIDAFSSLGSFGAPALDGNGDHLPDVAIYFSVDNLSGGLPASTIWVKPTGSLPMHPYASFASLGLGPNDQIDALSIWDQSPGGGPSNGLYDPGDGVIFSLGAGSPSLPRMVGDVSIDASGIFLSTPGTGIVAALPGGYFSLSSSDELDAIHVIDPRSTLPVSCLLNPGRADAIAPFEGLSLLQDRVVLGPGDASARIAVFLNESDRIPAAGGVIGYTVNVSVGDPSVARVESASPSWCGYVPGFPSPPQCCTRCSLGPPDPNYLSDTPCPGPTGTFSGCALNSPQTPALRGSNLCLGEVQVKPLSPGWTSVVVSVVANGEFGPVPVETAEAFLRVRVPTSTGETEASRTFLWTPSVAGAGPVEIRYSIGPASPRLARLEFYDVAGRRLRTLPAGGGPGDHVLTWDRRDEHGTRVARGIYMVELRAGTERLARKLVLAHE